MGWVVVCLYLPCFSWEHLEGEAICHAVQKSEGWLNWRFFKTNIDGWGDMIDTLNKYIYLLTICTFEWSPPSSSSSNTWCFIMIYHRRYSGFTLNLRGMLKFPLGGHVFVIGFYMLHNPSFSLVPFHAVWTLEFLHNHNIFYCFFMFYFTVLVEPSSWLEFFLVFLTLNLISI